MTTNTEIIQAEPEKRYEIATVTPSQVLMKAMDANASIEHMTQLLELQEKFERREAEKAFHLALADFKATTVKILKDKHVSYETKNGGLTEYDHATLGNVVYTISQELSRHGLSSTWDTKQSDGGLITVTCILSHKLGHQTRTSLTAGRDESGGKNNIQGLGSTLSYLERYTLLAATGLATHDQDDDGIAAGDLPELKEPITTDQAIELNDLMVEHGTDKAKFLHFFSGKVGYRIPSVEQLPSDAYKPAKDMITRSRQTSSISDKANNAQTGNPHHNK